jgi:four helix bundle protein
MNNENLKRRTRKFALEVIKLVEGLPSDRTCSVLGTQLLRAATSVGANYRSACRAKSLADFISKMGTVEEEADESGYWMELLVDAGKLAINKVESLINEANQLTAISVASINTARKGAGKTGPSAPAARDHSALRTAHSALLPGPSSSEPVVASSHSALRTAHSALE